MPEELVPTVEAAGVSAQKPFHARHQIGLGRLDDQVKVIHHHAICMHLPTRLEAGLAERFQESLAIGVILEDRFAPIPSIHDVIHRAGILDSHLARHERDCLSP